MYLQVQALIPIHESTPQSAIISCYLTKIFIEIHCNSTYKPGINNRIGICMTCFTNSDTTKNAGIGPILILMPVLGAALVGIGMHGMEAFI